MQRFFLAIALMAGTWLAAFPSPAQAAPCLLVTLTGTMSGPVLLNGVAGAGTLVRYGDDSGDCSAVKLQFDAGRGTALRLSQVNLDVGQLDAIFFTHMHSDHTDGFADIMQARWNWNSAGPRLDVVCSADAPSPLGFTMSCRNLVAHVGDAFIQSGEIAQRISEDKRRLAGGPTELGHLITFDPRDEPQAVWSKGDIRVSAITGLHASTSDDGDTRPPDLTEWHLRRILALYSSYYNQTRTHLALRKDAPLRRAVQGSGTIIATPILFGLHHRYA
jgi:ribonuclease Z